ncbi:serine/threonine protein kinase [Catenulispora sp. EB89]|uniref:protein kinase domain-containing protein n=1 Tax=Catenulispora sp. EB89 TaxID=3156257 RepID=UPI0035179970
MWGTGTVLAGRYRLVSRISGGSMGDVWRAEDVVLAREVAVKLLLPALVGARGFAQRFRTEARVMAAIRHPGVLKVYDYGEAAPPSGEHPDGLPAYLVMELLEGRDLASLIEEQGALPLATALDYTAQAAAALQAAHERGIVHRDVKPSNLIVRSEGGIALGDFGIAREGEGSGLTATDTVLGTAPYLAPEQISQGAVTPLSDLYSLGVVAYQCLTGELPFDRGSSAAILYAHVHEPPPPLPDSIPADVRELVGRALAKDPARRWADAGEMARAARACADAAAAAASTALSGSVDGDSDADEESEEPEEPEGYVAWTSAYRREVPETPAVEQDPSADPRGSQDDDEESPRESEAAAKQPSTPRPDRSTRRPAPVFAVVAAVVAIAVAVAVSVGTGGSKAKGTTTVADAGVTTSAATSSGVLVSDGSLPSPAATPGRTSASGSAGPSSSGTPAGVPSGPQPTGTASGKTAPTNPPSSSRRAAPSGSRPSGPTAGSTSTSTGAPPPPTGNPPASNSSPPGTPATSNAPATLPSHPAHMMTNVGDGLSVDVTGEDAGDGSKIVAWDQHTTNSGQYWQVQQYRGPNGSQAWAFLTYLNTYQVMTMDPSSHGVIMQHCGSPCANNQVWWYAASSINGAVYIHNGYFDACLTDNGRDAQLTVEPCTTGNRAQLWETP